MQDAGRRARGAGRCQLRLLATRRLRAAHTHPRARPERWQPRDANRLHGGAAAEPAAECVTMLDECWNSALELLLLLRGHGVFMRVWEHRAPLL